MVFSYKLLNKINIYKQILKYNIFNILKITLYLDEYNYFFKFF
jgi:hypothetical protein